MPKKTSPTDENKKAPKKPAESASKGTTSASSPEDNLKRFPSTLDAAGLLERRKAPRISSTPPAPDAPPKFDDYAAIVGEAELGEIRYVAETLRGRTVKMVNSTAVGGGVAEILNRLIP